jgi:hypothetical protein
MTVKTLYMTNIIHAIFFTKSSNRYKRSAKDSQTTQNLYITNKQNETKGYTYILRTD